MIRVLSERIHRCTTYVFFYRGGLLRGLIVVLTVISSREPAPRRPSGEELFVAGGVIRGAS